MSSSWRSRGKEPAWSEWIWDESGYYASYRPHSTRLGEYEWRYQYPNPPANILDSPSSGPSQEKSLSPDLPFTEIATRSKSQTPSFTRYSPEDLQSSQTTSRASTFSPAQPFQSYTSVPNQSQATSFKQDTINYSQSSQTTPYESNFSSAQPIPSYASAANIRNERNQYAAPSFSQRSSNYPQSSQNISYEQTFSSAQHASNSPSTTNNFNGAYQYSTSPSTVIPSFQSLNLASDDIPSPMLSHAHMAQPEHLDDRYIEVTDAKRYFQVGRVFKTPWVEPAAPTNRRETSSTPQVQVRFGQSAFSEIRRFVVIATGHGSCTCCALHSYSGQGTLKPNIQSSNTHAVVFPQGENPGTAPGEQLTIDPFPIIIDNKEERLDRMTRINFSKLYTVEHFVKVIKIGRIPPEEIPRLLAHTPLKPPAENYVEPGGARISRPSSVLETDKRTGRKSRYHKPRR